MKENIVPVDMVVQNDLKNLAIKYNRLPQGAKIDDFFALYEQTETI